MKGRGEVPASVIQEREGRRVPFYRRLERWCRSEACLSLSRSLRRLLEEPLGFV